MPTPYNSSGTSLVFEATSAADLGGTRGGRINMLQDKYLPAWDDHVHTGTKLAKIIAKKKGTMSGVRSLGHVIDAYPQSVGVGQFENALLPTPTSSTEFNPQIIPRWIMSRLRFSKQVRLAARGGDSAAWGDIKRQDMEAAKKQMDINFERMLWLGNAQVLATLSANNQTTGATLYGRNARTSAANDRWKFGAHYLRKNMSVALVSASSSNVQTLKGADSATDTTTISTERVVTSTPDSSSPDAPTFLVNKPGDAATIGWASDPSSNADKSIVIPYGSRVASATATGTDAAQYDSYLAGINGLGNLMVSVNERAYVYGLSRTTYPTLNSFVQNFSGTPVAWKEQRIALAVDRINDDGTGDDPDNMFMHSSVRREYIKETIGDRRFESVQAEKGYAKLVFSAGDVPLPISTSRDCPPGSVFVFDSTQFGWFSEAELQMLDDGERFVTDKAQHEVAFIKSGNLACMKPHNCALIEDIIIDTQALTS